MQISHSEPVQINSELDGWSIRLQAHAGAVRDRFFAQVRAARAAVRNPATHFGRMEPKVSVAGGVPYISWRHVTFHGAKRNPRAVHIAKGRRTKYSDASLMRKAAVWEMAAIEIAEGEFAQIREQVEAIARVRRAIQKLLPPDDFNY